eukprot:scaffold229845_cov66-Cyclotella_meneghiniana.AAC.1
MGSSSLPMWKPAEAGFTALAMVTTKSGMALEWGSMRPRPPWAREMYAMAIDVAGMEGVLVRVARKDCAMLWMREARGPFHWSYSGGLVVSRE